MDGLAIKVKTIDGAETIYKLTPRIIVAFEQHFAKGLPHLIGTEQKIEHIYWLAWKAQQVNGVVVKPFGPDYLDTILSAELDADPNFASTEKA
jgi:hypothetical protein